MAESWPAWATQQVEIVDWNPNWMQLARDLVSDVSRRLVRWLDGSVEHVGSTAVPGLAAKPVVDLIAPVGSVADAAEVADVLTEGGWQLVPPGLDRRPWRRMYVLPQDDRRLAHLHLVERNHPRWREMILFRDRLRQHSELVSEYARLKRLAAGAHSDDREAYTAAKAAFIEDVVTRSA